MHVDINDVGETEITGFKLTNTFPKFSKKTAKLWMCLDKQGVYMS